MNHLVNRKNIVAIFAVSTALLLLTSLSHAQQFSGWSEPQNLGPIINTTSAEQNSTISPSGLSLYFSSNRPGGLGGTDVYVSQRATLTSAWGAPQNLGATVNSSSGEAALSFSLDGRTMFFQSDRPGGLGGFDMYIMTRTDPNIDFDWSAPVHLGAVINSAFAELGVTYFEDPSTGAGTLIFNSDRPGGAGGFDFYQSTRNADGTFNAPVLITELNSPANDLRPAIRRDGLEIFITTNRPGVLGMNDIFVSTRASVSAPWNPPVPVANINTESNEAAPTLSADGRTIYFNSNRAGGSGDMDLYSSARDPQRYSAWSAPENLGANINTTALEGCPFIAPDNLSLFFASDRAGGSGGTDIYVSNRASSNAPWGTPLNLGANINTSGAEFCPTLIAGGLTLYFVSDKPGGCGGNDIYVSQRLNNQGEWGPALNLGCQFNSPQSDITPSLFTDNNGTTFLYFSSDRPGGLGMQDIYVSTLQANGSFGTPILVDGLNTASNDLRPNIRVRDGLEIFFESNRPGTLGLTDLYVSTRANTSSAWSTPENLGAVVNSASGESRPSLSFNGLELYFQSNRPGGFGNADVFVTRRTANVTVSGRVLTSDGRGLRNATMSITDSNGVVRTTTTSSFGFFSFDNVSAGQAYSFRIFSRFFRFQPRTVQVDGNLTLTDFVGLE